MAKNVRFVRTTKEKYLNKTSYDPLALYFCEDTNEMFKGDSIISDGIRVVPTYNDLPECSCAADGIVYYVAETRNGYTLSPDRTEWLQTIYAPATDAYTVPENEIYNTVTTVGAVRDIEKAIYTYVDQEIAGVEASDGVNYINFAGVTMTEADGIFSIDQESARQALGITVPTSDDGEPVIIATETVVTEKVTEMSDELKTYIDEQIKEIEVVGNFNGGEI